MVKRDRQKKTILEGKYILTIDGLVENGIFAQFVATQKKSSISLPINLIRGIAIYASRELNCRGTVTTSGFTLCKLNIENGMKYLDAHPNLHKTESGMIGVSLNGRLQVVYLKLTPA